MTRQHTPGPWYADKRGGIWRRPPHELYCFGGKVTGERPLAMVDHGWVGDSLSGYPLESNARLIAASPDLLGALNAMLTHMGMDEDEWNKPTFDKARAAIAKATGESNVPAITAVKAALEEKDEPHGWKLVPIEPTYEMLKAMDECSTEGYDERLYAGHAASVYMAAVNVAPSPSQQHAEDLAKLGWQYFECPACGSEGAKAFPKSEAKDEKHGSPCPEFWDWLPKSYRNGDADDLPKFTKYNMEVAFLAGKQSVALEAKDEPVAVVSGYYGGQCVVLPTNPARLFNSGTAFYTTPPQRKPLTDEHIQNIWHDQTGLNYFAHVAEFARAIEAARN